MMRFFNSRFARWLDDHQSEPPLEHDSALRAEALNALVESINTGVNYLLGWRRALIFKINRALQGIFLEVSGRKLICATNLTY